MLPSLLPKRGADPGRCYRKPQRPSPWRPAPSRGSSCPSPASRRPCGPSSTRSRTGRAPSGRTASRSSARARAASDPGVRPTGGQQWPITVPERRPPGGAENTSFSRTLATASSASLAAGGRNTTRVESYFGRTSRRSRWDHCHSTATVLPVRLMSSQRSACWCE